MALLDTLTSIFPSMTTLMPKYQEQTFTEFKVAQVIIVYGLPILILAGTISNIISLIILRCKSFRSSSVSFSLSVLSGVNLGILYVAVLRLWVLELTDKNVEFRVTSFGCKVHIMLTYLLCHMSSWTLVLIVLERTLIVCFPLAAKPYCSRRNTIIVWCITTGVLVLINCHFLWTFGYIPDPLKFSYFEIKQPASNFTRIFRMRLENFNTTIPPAITTTQTGASWNHTIMGLKNQSDKLYQKICYAHPEYLYFYHNVWPWIDAIMISILPFLLLLAGNLAIVVTISKAVKFRMESTSRQSTSSYNKTNSVFSEATQSASTGTLERQACTVLRLKGKKPKSLSCGSDKHVSSSTYMLLGASFLFLLLTTPSGVYLLISDYLFESDSSPGSVAKYRLAFSVTIFLYYLNNSINFFIYYLTGSRFRKSFKEYFSSRDTLDSEGKLSDGGTKVSKLTYLSTVLKAKLKVLNIEFGQKV